MFYSFLWKTRGKSGWSWAEIQTKYEWSYSEPKFRGSDYVMEHRGSFLTVYPLSPTSPGNPGAPVWPCGRGQERLKRHQVSHDLNWPQSSDIYPKYWRIQSLMRAGKIRWRGHRWDGETWVLCCRKTVFTYVHQEKCKTFIMFCFHTFSPSRPWTPSLPSSPWDPWTGNRDSIVLWTAEIYDILKINKINRCFYWKLEEKSNPTERWRWN